MKQPDIVYVKDAEGNYKPMTAYVFAGVIKYVFFQGVCNGITDMLKHAYGASVRLEDDGVIEQTTVTPDNVHEIAGKVGSALCDDNFRNSDVVHALVNATMAEGTRLDQEEQGEKGEMIKWVLWHMRTGMHHD